MKKIALISMVTVLLSACGASDDTEVKADNVVLAPVDSDNKNGNEDDNSVTDPAYASALSVDVIDESMAIPGNIKVTRDANNVNLNWMPVKGATGYNVYYSNSDDVTEQDLAYSSSKARFSHQNLASDNYHYKVQAVNDGIGSNLSIQINADLTNPQVSFNDTVD